MIETYRPRRLIFACRAPAIDGADGVRRGRSSAPTSSRGEARPGLLVHAHGWTGGDGRVELPFPAPSDARSRCVLPVDARGGDGIETPDARSCAGTAPNFGRGRGLLKRLGQSRRRRLRPGRPLTQHHRRLRARRYQVRLQRMRRRGRPRTGQRLRLLGRSFGRCTPRCTPSPQLSSTPQLRRSLSIRRARGCSPSTRHRSRSS